MHRTRPTARPRARGAQPARCRASQPTQGGSPDRGVALGSHRHPWSPRRGRLASHRRVRERTVRRMQPRGELRTRCTRLGRQGCARSAQARPPGRWASPGRRYRSQGSSCGPLGSSWPTSCRGSSRRGRAAPTGPRWGSSRGLPRPDRPANRPWPPVAAPWLPWPPPALGQGSIPGGCVAPPTGSCRHQCGASIWTR